MSGGGGGAVRAVKSQCGEVAVRWRGGAVAQAACGGGLGCVSAAWREVGRRANMGSNSLGL